MFNTNDEIKISICDIIIHNDMRIPVDSHQTNKNFSATFQQKKACLSEYADYLWIPFIDQPQSDIVVFVIITFQI